MGFWLQLGREYLAFHGATEGVDEILERSVPMTMTQTGALFIEAFSIPGTPESVAADMNAMMDAHYHRDIPLKPGVRAYLDALHRAGAHMCVASATDPELIAACLTRLGVVHYFDALLSCKDVGVGKDSPAVYLEAAARMGSTPEETAVFEDVLFAAKTAKQAGFYTVAVWDPNSAAQWEALAALADEAILDWTQAVPTL